MVSDSLNPYEIDEEESLDKTPLEEWVEYLKNGIINPETKAPGLQEAREKLKYYSMTNAERHAYDEHVVVGAEKCIAPFYISHIIREE